MIQKDKKGRIKFISLDDPVNSGHSVCNSCGKDMPRCWDVVCAKCNGTFCYDCARSKGGYWFCLKCRPLKLWEKIFGRRYK